MKILRMMAAALAATCAGGLMDCGNSSDASQAAAAVQITCGPGTQDNGSGVCVLAQSNNTR
jgi:hypothetical protein